MCQQQVSINMNYENVNVHKPSPNCQRTCNISTARANNIVQGSLMMWETRAHFTMAPCVLKPRDHKPHSDTLNSYPQLSRHHSPHPPHCSVDLLYCVSIMDDGDLDDLCIKDCVRCRIKLRIIWAREKEMDERQRGTSILRASMHLKYCTRTISFPPPTPIPCNSICYILTFYRFRLKFSFPSWAHFLSNSPFLYSFIFSSHLSLFPNITVTESQAGANVKIMRRKENVKTENEWSWKLRGLILGEALII